MARHQSSTIFHHISPYFTWYVFPWFHTLGSSTWNDQSMAIFYLHAPQRGLHIKEYVFWMLIWTWTMSRMRATTFGVLEVTYTDHGPRTYDLLKIIGVSLGCVFFSTVFYGFVVEKIIPDTWVISSLEPWAKGKWSSIWYIDRERDRTKGRFHPPDQSVCLILYPRRIGHALNRSRNYTVSPYKLSRLRAPCRSCTWWSATSAEFLCGWETHGH